MLYSCNQFVKRCKLRYTIYTVFWGDKRFTLMRDILLIEMAEQLYIQNYNLVRFSINQPKNDKVRQFINDFYLPRIKEYNYMINLREIKNVSGKDREIGRRIILKLKEITIIIK